MVEDRVTREISLKSRWVAHLCLLDFDAYRLLCVFAGISGVFAVGHYLPWADPFLSPPFPARHRGLGTVFALIEHPAWTLVVFVVATIAALGLILGRWPRVASWILLLFIAGIVSAARPLTSSAAGVLCLIYFWIGMMPPAARADGALRGMAVLGLRVQIVLVYLCGVVFKLFDPAWQEGLPLVGALVGHTWESGLGRWVALESPPWLLAAMGRVVPAAEFVGGLALLVPLPWVRRAGVFLLILFHLGTAFLMTLELFPLAMVTGLAVFWDSSMVAGLRRVGHRVWAWRAKFRESVAGGMMILSLAVALGQVLFPRVGLGGAGERIVQFVRPLNSTARYDQRWTMFTTSGLTPSPERGQPKKTYRTTRLLVKTKGGELFDPFLGSVSSVEAALRRGNEHSAVSRKALSYLQKQRGQWRERQIRAFGDWALSKAIAAGYSPVAVYIYRYQIPVDLSQPLQAQFREKKAVARLWVRAEVNESDGKIAKIAIFGTRESAPLRVRLMVE